MCVCVCVCADSEKKMVACHVRVSVLSQESDGLFAACDMCVVPIEKRDDLFIVICVCFCV